MARLMFASENSNNNDQTTSIAAPDNKCTDVLIMTNDSKDSTTTAKRVVAVAAREQTYPTECAIGSHESSCQSSTTGEYRAAAAATTMSESSLVARLSAKFDSVEASNDCLSGISPRETPSLTTSYPAEKAITVRNSSVQKTIKFFEKDATNKAAAATTTISSSEVIKTESSDKDCNNSTRESTQYQRNSESRAHLGCEPRHLNGNDEFYKSERNAAAKPRVQPKPTILLQKVSAERQSMSQTSPSDETRSCKIIDNLHREKIYHAPKIYVKTDRNLVLKDKRLSIAKDFSLESVLNSDLQNKLEAEGRSDDAMDDAQKSAALTYDTKTANNSFLHKYLEQCLENNNNNNKSGAEDESPTKQQHPQEDCPQDEEELLVARSNKKNSSALHDSLIKTLNEARLHANGGDYEDLYSKDNDVIGDAVDENANGHHYQYLEETDLSNVYADIIYAQLNNNDGIENYETISSESRGNSPTTVKNDFVSQSSDHVYSGSESSLEQTNSLYDSKPTSDFSSTHASVFSLSNNDCPRTKSEDSRISVTTSSGITDDDEDADYCDSDVNESLTVTSVNRKRIKIFKKRKLRFLLQRKDTQPVAPHEPENPIEDLCDDFDDSSSDQESDDMNEQNTTVHRKKKHSISSVTQSQNIYGFVEKARKTVRKSWSSLNQIRKMSVGNIAAKTQDISISSNRSKSVSVAEIDYKNGHSAGPGGSVRWTSFKSKLKPKYSTVTSSTSIFYLPPEDLLFKKSCSPSENVTKKQNGATKNNRRRTTCIELRPTRPTSPPPPPPVDRSKISDANSASTLSIYSDPSTRSSNSGSEVNSELNSSRSSDLHLRFADEPLYQFYAESIAQLSTTDSLSIFTDSDGYEEIASTTSRPSAMELITPSPNGHGQHRSLWCEVPEVKNRGILDTLSPSKKKLQEAIFEIITSEASYYKSLSVLDKVYANSPLLKDETILSKTHWKILFGNVTAVKKCSEKLLASLEKCWQESILLTGLCDVIYLHARDNFQVYVKYCSNQIYIDRTLKELKEHNARFTEVISQLESDPACQSLNIASFLMLPMQRITRMPLLIDAVLSKMDPIQDQDEYTTYQISLATLNKIVRDCNDSACKLERYEEMLLLSQQLEFSRKDMKMYTIASSSRWLIRSGPMEHINQPDMKLTLTKKLTKHTTKLHFFLFNDIFIVAKKKSDAPTYVVFDYCARNVVQMNLLDDNRCGGVPAVSLSNYRYLLLLTLLENHEKKTVEMVLNCDSDSTRQRWLEATSSHLTSDNPDEKLYEEWDCPQVSVIHSYTAVQPDELSLHAGDVVKVLKKTTDGWCHGERIRDGMTGWFPGNYTVEIASQHTRAKNLKIRHRLLTLSASYLQDQQQQKKT